MISLSDHQIGIVMQAARLHAQPIETPLDGGISQRVAANNKIKQRSDAESAMRDR